jgi:hypothetical protein
MGTISKKWGITFLPPFVRTLFRGMPGVFRHRHQLVFCWLVMMQMILSGPRTLTRLCAPAPSWITEWRFRRLLSAAYWGLHLLLWWFAEQAIKSFPEPEDKVVYVIADGSKKDKRGKKNPATQKGREGQHSSWFFGIRFVVLMLAWDVYRIPVDFCLVLPKNHPDYETENMLFRKMLKRLDPPPWAEWVIVAGDAAFGSKENMQLVKQIDKSDHQRRWGFVFAIARTWKMKNDKSVKNLVKHTPLSCYQRTWIPPLVTNQRRKTFWVFQKRIRLRHIEDVTLVLSKKGRNVGPKKTKILVTNLLELTARQVLSIYQRRWSIEILFKELKSGLGLGEHQVTKKIVRVEKSFGIAIIAYLILIRARKEDIKPGHAWSIFELKNNFTMHLIQNQFEHSMELKLNKLRKAA